MAARHIRRFVPPWCRESQKTFCKKSITPGPRLVSVDELDAASIEHFTSPVRRVSAWVGDETKRRVCQTLDVCRLCMNQVSELRSWDEDPVQCMAQHAAHTAEWRHPAERIQALAELMTIAHLIGAHREEFEQTLRRESTLLTLRGPTG